MNKGFIANSLRIGIPENKERWQAITVAFSVLIFPEHKTQDSCLLAH